MTCLIDTQSLIALNEQQLIAIYATLKSELEQLEPSSDAARSTAHAIDQVLRMLNRKRVHRTRTHCKPTL